MVGFYIHIGSVACLYIAALFGRLMINNESDLKKVSRVSHFVLSVLNLVIFGGYFLVFFFPGISAIHQFLGLGGLNMPFYLRVILGSFLLCAGTLMYYITVNELINRGKGFSAYKFTEKIVTESIYKYLRHPMSLGYYLFVLGFPFIFDSMYLLLITLFGFIPAQLFYVLIYEEKELELRFKNDYREYRKRVAFIIPRFL